jgi:hypothetical protein
MLMLFKKTENAHLLPNLKQRNTWKRVTHNTTVLLLVLMPSPIHDAGGGGRPLVRFVRAARKAQTA